MLNTEQDLTIQTSLAHPLKPIKYHESVYSQNPYVPFGMSEFKIKLLASLYALGIVIDIFSTGKNLSLLKTQNKFEWGIQKQDQIEFCIPQSMNIDDSNPPVFSICNALGNRPFIAGIHVKVCKFMFKRH